MTQIEFFRPSIEFFRPSAVLKSKPFAEEKSVLWWQIAGSMCIHILFTYKYVFSHIEYDLFTNLGINDDELWILFLGTYEVKLHVMEMCCHKRISGAQLQGRHPN